MSFKFINQKTEGKITVGDIIDADQLGRCEVYQLEDMGTFTVRRIASDTYYRLTGYRIGALA